MSIALNNSSAWGQRACVWRLSNLRTAVLGRTCALTFSFRLQQSKESKVRQQCLGICHVCENRTAPGWWPCRCMKRGKVLSSITIHKFTPASLFFYLARSVRFVFLLKDVWYCTCKCVWVAIVNTFVIFWGEFNVEAVFFRWLREELWPWSVLLLERSCNRMG